MALETAGLAELPEVVAFLLGSGVSPRALVWADRQLEARRPRHDVFVAGRRLLTTSRQGRRPELEQYHALRAVAQERRAAHLAQVRQAATALLGLRIFGRRGQLLRHVLGFLRARRREEDISLHVLCTRCRFAGDVFAAWEHVAAQHLGD